MKAYVFDRKLKKIRLAEVPVQEPEDTEVLIQIRAVSVNAADCRSMKMGMVPKRGIYGSDISGEIVKTGSGVRNFKVHDEVVADLSGCGMGGFAEFVSVPENVPVRKPEGLTHQAAAAMPMASVTALQALRKGNICKGQKVLIYGASGGVGSFVVQLAAHFRAEVTGVCSGKNAETVKSLGAGTVIDYEKQDVFSMNEKYDLILAVHGNNTLRAYAKILGAKGRLVVVGGELSQIFRAMLFGPLYSFGDKKLTVLAAKPVAEDLTSILELAAAGKITAHIERVSGFAALPDVIDYVGNGHARGKIVISSPTL